MESLEDEEIQSRVLLMELMTRMCSNIMMKILKKVFEEEC